MKLPQKYESHPKSESLHTIVTHSLKTWIFFWNCQNSSWEYVMFYINFMIETFMFCILLKTVRTLDEVLSASKSPALSTSSPQPLVSKGVFQVLPYYCQYCHKQFPNLENLHQHLQTLEHRSSVDSDMEKAGDWKYRDLPLNVVNGGIIRLCKV